MKLLDLLPFERFTLATNLSVDEVKRKLKTHIDSAEKQLEPYKGHISIDGFDMERKITYRNSFLPQIKGRFANGMGRTEIRITMKLALSVLIFMCIWMGGVGMFCIVITIGLITNSPELAKDGMLLFKVMPFMMFAGGYLMMTILFKMESKQSKQFLQRLAEAEIVA